MKVIYAVDVNDAYTQGVRLLMSEGRRQGSRAGDVLVMPSPVMTVTDCPRMRVLLDPKRRANPFFHLFESLWMLSGRRDAKWLDQFVHDFSERFGEPDEDGDQHGAYGHRWRRHFDFDQIESCVALLRADPLDRRVVLAMWDPDTDLAASKRDVPCNTHIYPRVRGEVLDITVCCRSNDAYWGAHGANAVHFSVLQEYLAARIGVRVGAMYQLSNNYHIYTSVLPERPPSSVISYPRAPMAMVTDPTTFDDDLELFMREPKRPGSHYGNSWFPRVAAPMWELNEARVAKNREWFDETLPSVAAPDWRAAAKMWRPSC